MPKLLFLVTEDWYFQSHRISLGVSALAGGYDVVLVTRVGEQAAEIEGRGIRVRAVGWRRRGFRPLRELRALYAIWSIYREERPDVVHHVALKPIVYGGLVARMVGVPITVHAITGLGFVFVSRRYWARILRPVLGRVLGWLLAAPGSVVIVQNPDDRDAVESVGVDAKRICLIPGSGVDEQKFRSIPEPSATKRGGMPIVASVVSRMLWDKGIGEFVEAARLLRERKVMLRLRLIGPADDDNPASIPASTLRQWVAEGVVEWCGLREDIPQAWAESHIAVLPSYREGLPRSMLEAAAVGRPIVTTDVPGCREIVEPGVNGILVPARDPISLANAIETLARNGPLRRQFGAASRRMIEERFTERIIVAATLKLYAQAHAVGGVGQASFDA